MLETALESTNTLLACSSSSIELSPKENLSSSSSTSSRSGSFCLYKAKIKKFKQQSKCNSSLSLKKKLKRAYKLNRYASLSSASSTSSSSSSASCSPQKIQEQTSTTTKLAENITSSSTVTKPTKKPMKLHKFYHSVPFKCPFCFTFKEIPGDFIDHLTSIHFSDVKLLYEKKCSEQNEGQQRAESNQDTIDPTSQFSKLKKLIKDFEEEQDEQDRAEDEHAEKENLNNQLDEENEQEIHTPPKTPPLNQTSQTSADTNQAQNATQSSTPKSTYLSMNSSVLPPRKQQRLLKSPFNTDNNQNNSQNDSTAPQESQTNPIGNTLNDLSNSQKLFKTSSSFSVPSLLSEHPPQPFMNINSLALAASLINHPRGENSSALNRQPSVSNTNSNNTNSNQEASMKCAICDRGFEYYSNLRRHIKTKHKIYGKQVKEYVIRHNNQVGNIRLNGNHGNNYHSNQAENAKNDQSLVTNGKMSPLSFISSSSSSTSSSSSNKTKLENELNESPDDDMDQAEVASSTSTSSSSFSQVNVPMSSSSKLFSSVQASPPLPPHAPPSGPLMAAFGLMPPQTQMMAFLTNHTNAMSKIKSSLLESLLQRKDDNPEPNKVQNFTKLIQNIVEMNQLSQFNMFAAAMGNGNAKLEPVDEAIVGKKNSEVEKEQESLLEEQASVHCDAKKKKLNRRYNQSAFHPLQKSDEESDLDLYDEEHNNNNNTETKKEENNSFCDYEEEGNLEQEKNNLNNKSLNDEDLEETSSSRSYQSNCDQGANKFLFNTGAPPASQYALEAHLRNLTQNNFTHHYQTYQQSLQRNFSLPNQFSTPSQTPAPIASPSGFRRKRSKDFSMTSSMVASMRNLQCSPTQSSTESAQNAQNSNQIRFSTEIWRCPYCCYETTSASRYNSHLVCHGWKPYLCPHCGSRSNRLPDMRTHISTFHPEFNVNTFVVLSEEEAKSTLKDYMKNRALINRKLKEMRPQPKFKCKLCPYASLYQFNLTKHVKSVHLSDVYNHNNNNSTNSNQSASNNNNNNNDS